MSEERRARGEAGVVENEAADPSEEGPPSIIDLRYEEALAAVDDLRARLANRRRELRAQEGGAARSFTRDAPSAPDDEDILPPPPQPPAAPAERDPAASPTARAELTPGLEPASRATAPEERSSPAAPPATARPMPPRPRAESRSGATLPRAAAPQQVPPSERAAGRSPITSGVPRPTAAPDPRSQAWEAPPVPTVSDAPRRVRISTGTVVAMGFAAALAAALTVVLLELGAQRPTATVPEPAQVLPGAPESNAQSEAGETGDASGSDQPGSPDEPGEGGRGARARRTYFNARAGYGFNYPRSWSLRSRGETSKVSSPDRTEVVSFALGPVSLPVTYDSFSELLRASYARVSLTRQHPVTLSGHAAIEVTGRAVNGSGVPLRFRALLVERPGSRSVGAFVATRGRRPPSRDALRILSSLHLAAQT